MPRNKTQKKYNKKKQKGMGSKFSAPAKETKEKTPPPTSNRKTKKNVTFKETPDVLGESPEETDQCYNCYSRSDQTKRRDALRDEAKELGFRKKGEIEYYVETRLKQVKDSQKRNKKIVRETKPYYLNRREQAEKERILHEFIGQVRK
jgi:hypothetical protein